MTRAGRSRSASPPRLQAGTHTPQPRQISSFTRAVLTRGRTGSLADTSAMASTGHASTHAPQPLQRPLSTDGR